MLIIDDLGMRKLLPSAADDLLELIMRRYERASTLITSNRPVEDWGKLLGRDRDARSAPSSRTRDQVWTSKLENEGGSRLAIGRGGGVTGACLGFRPLAGFQVTAFGRISSDR